ncbi:MAG TPA: protein-L-isoaspartate(D-aspartate) O-methyltransferase [Oligoflexia bacterium]|nr:protein-L-isoaspartate(D-aspartate) O-methyltransferase [Oligoflexia bacterium]HMR23781.1 protein-L-isoaspartate(D-aspartate) O-methyltransferase [Oligoflexia bacterium]
MQKQTEAHFKAGKMIEQWVVPKGITNQEVINAMASIPRHYFVPEAFSLHAYGENALPIGHDQTISQPYIVALMTQAMLETLGHTPKKVLEIGTGSGYQAAVLDRLGIPVFSIERIHALASVAKKRLEDLGFYKVLVKTGNGALGWSEFAPYEAVMITAAIKKIPQQLFSQLADRAVLVAPVDEGKDEHALYIYLKENNKIKKRFLGSCKFVPFIT